MWERKAACIGKPVNFFFPRETDHAAKKAALDFCSTACRVRQECLDDALSYPPKQDQGIRGGKTEFQRNSIRNLPVGAPRRDADFERPKPKPVNPKGVTPNSFQKYNEERAAQAAKRRCKAGDCDNKVVSRGYCQTHYDKFVRSVPCKADGCTNKNRARGYCARHDAIFTEPKPGCTEDGCAGEAMRDGLCRVHYDRLHGDIESLVLD